MSRRCPLRLARASALHRCGARNHRPHGGGRLPRARARRASGRPPPCAVASLALLDRLRRSVRAGPSAPAPCSRSYSVRLPSRASRSRSPTRAPSARTATTGRALLLGPAGVVLLALGVRLLWRSRHRHGHSYLRRPSSPRRPSLGAYWVPRARRRRADGDPSAGRGGHARSTSAAPAPPSRCGRRTGSTGRPLRGLEERRRGDRLPRQRQPGAAGARARPPRLRRADARPARLRRRARATRTPSAGAGGRTSTPPSPSSRAAPTSGRPDRRTWLLGRRRSDARGGSRNTALRAVVADGAGERSVRESPLRGPAAWFSLPSYVVQTAAVSVLSGHTPPASLVDLDPADLSAPLAPDRRRRDNGGEDLQPHYFAAAGQPKAFWKIPEAGHTGGYAARPDEYARRLTAFFDAWLLGGRRAPASLLRGAQRNSAFQKRFRTISAIAIDL